MSAAAAIIAVDDLTYEYPGLRALDGVSFTIAPGSITALVGPNGAGKTTLLRCLAGLDRPLSGSITVAGVDVVEEPRRSHRSIGYLSDFFGLYDDLTVRRSLNYVAAANGIHAEQRPALVESTAAATGLSERLEHRAGALSRGLRQRVAIAQAIIHGPAVILLDEPAAGLDPEARYALGELFVSLRARGISLLVSSHILAELEAYSTDMLILRAGRVVEHRRLGTSPGNSVTLAIDVLGEVEPLLSALRTSAGASAIVARARGARLQFDGDENARAALLAALLAHGLAITQFAIVDEDLQQSYLRTINPGDDADEP